MNIVYGISGEGLGHVFEGIEIISLLQRDGHTVKVLTYGERALNLLQPFSPTHIGGIHLEMTPRGFSLWSTVVGNIHLAGFYIKNWGKLKKELADFKPDVFITAYEPYTTLVSHVFRKPLISIDNQNELLHINKPAGVSWFDFKLVQWSTRICTWGASHYIIKSFNKNNKSTSNRYFVSPIIQRDTRVAQTTVGSHIFVYLTKPNPSLIEILKGMPEHFIVYSNNKVGNEGNLVYRAAGGARYLEDLRTCKAIIGTTGFSLIADALFLKKPYFGVPLKKQFEQIYNAHFLKNYGIGEFSTDVSRKDLDSFLNNLLTYRAHLEKYNFNPQEQEEALRKILTTVSV